MRRQRVDGQRSLPEGDPPGDARRHVRGRGDRREPEDGSRVGRFLRLRGEGARLRDREGPLPLAQRPPIRRQGVRRIRGDRQRLAAVPRGAASRPQGERARRRGRGPSRPGRRRLPRARQRAHLRQARLGLSERQRHPRRRAESRPDPDPRAARGGAGVGVDVSRAGLRDPRGPARRRRC